MLLCKLGSVLLQFDEVMGNAGSQFSFFVAFVKNFGEMSTDCSMMIANGAAIKQVLGRRSPPAFIGDMEHGLGPWKKRAKLVARKTLAGGGPKKKLDVHPDDGLKVWKAENAVRAVIEYSDDEVEKKGDGADSGEHFQFPMPNYWPSSPFPYDEQIALMGGAKSESGSDFSDSDDEDSDSDDDDSDSNDDEDDEDDEDDDSHYDDMPPLIDGEGKYAAPLPALVNKEGQPMAITVSQDKGGLQASFVPIAQKVAKGKAAPPSKPRHVSFASEVEVHNFESSYEMEDSNVSKWSELEVPLSLFTEMFMTYTVGSTCYEDMQQLRDSNRDIGRSVAVGDISPKVGACEWLHNIRSGLNKFEGVVGESNICGTCMQQLNDLRLQMCEFETNMIKVERYDICDTGNWFDNELVNMFEDDGGAEMCVGESEEGKLPAIQKTDSEAGKTAYALDDEAPNVGEVAPNILNTHTIAPPSVGIVGDYHTFGDRDSGSDSSVGGSLKVLVSSDSEDSSVVSQPNFAAFRIRRQQNLFNKKMSRYELCLILLPEVMGREVRGFIGEMRSAIKNRGCTADKAYRKVVLKFGPLRTDAEMRRLFVQATYAADLDG